jgi:hypothetical protein
LIRRKTLTSEEEVEFWEEIEVRGSQIWGTGWIFQQFIVHIYTKTIHRTTQLTTLVGKLSGIRTQSGQTKM